MAIEEIIEELKRRVELASNRKPNTPKDFIYLSEIISEKTHQSISKTTIMRIWSYINEQSQVRTSTLDILSRYLNYRDFEAFKVYIENNSDESQQVLASHIRTSQLSLGQYIEFKWSTNKRMVIEYIREDLFEVKVAENTKIKIGSTFSCAQFIQGQPLHVFDLKYKTEFYDCFAIGQHHGITELHVLDSAPQV